MKSKQFDHGTSNTISFKSLGFALLFLYPNVYLFTFHRKNCLLCAKLVCSWMRNRFCGFDAHILCILKFVAKFHPAYPHDSIQGLTTFYEIWALALWVPARISIRGRNYAQATGPRIRSERKSWFYGPGSQNNVPFSWINCFLETRLSSESLDPLISLLAYLGSKLWLTNQKWDINSNPTKGNLSHFG